MTEISQQRAVLVAHMSDGALNAAFNLNKMSVYHLKVQNNLTLHL